MKQTFKLAQEIFPHSSMSITREMTKWHQTVHRVSELTEDLDLTAKGEMVFLIYIDDAQEGASSLGPLALQVLKDKGRPKTMAKLLGKILKRNPKELYAELVDRE